MSYKSITEKTTIAEAVSNAFSEWQSLRDEVTEVRDNLEEKFSSTERYQRYSEAADTLDGFCDNEPEVEENLGKRELNVVTMVNRSKRKAPSRAVRCGNAQAMLQACVDVLTGSDYEEDDSDAESLADELQQAIDEASGVEFPGMYG